MISPVAYNRSVGLELFCPITFRIKGYPLEVLIKGAAVEGVILADRVKIFDWRRRRMFFVGKSEENVIGEILSKILPLLQ